MKKDLKKFSSKFFSALAFAFMLGALTVQAQDDAKKEDAAAGEKKPSRLTFGIRSGLNLSEFIFAGTTNATLHTEGAQVGAFFNIKATNWVELSIEAAWAQNGAANLAGGGGSLHSFNFNNFQGNLLTYFKLPVLSVYEPKIFIGPSFDYIGSVTANSEVPSGTTNIKTRYDVSNRFKKLDVGIVAGLGVDFDLKFARLFLDARYRHGLLDLNDNVNTLGNEFGTTAARLPYRALGNSTIRTSQFSFQVGLGFSL